ncbi:hypothetical protein [Verminephrobacter eiseniae]|uniref:hypothetical protein n=1 Tax=Verminephrobacter eiseniae TaxID=364317 RepID=UPI002237C9E3|nr:hypothetical protein [Verminephrobacter eiseniae]
MVDHDDAAVAAHGFGRSHRAGVDRVHGLAAVAAPPGGTTRSTWPASNWSGSLIWFQRAISAVVRPARYAMRYSVSPVCTTYSPGPATGVLGVMEHAPTSNAAINAAHAPHLLPVTTTR